MTFISVGDKSNQKSAVNHEGPWRSPENKNFRYSTPTPISLAGPQEPKQQETRPVQEEVRRRVLVKDCSLGQGGSWPLSRWG